MKALRAGIEPVFQGRALAAFRKQQDTEPQLAENDRIDRDTPFIDAQPLDDARIRLNLRGLAQDVGVDQVLHSASV
ncbi:MAG TPA: hypothetical protein PK555_08865, partial [Steroidobacteraceae bacterium]|nr:hypothetical protein [Steroidobacteraceae bacterium]